jgi:hypothetical protein
MMPEGGPKQGAIPHSSQYDNIIRRVFGSAICHVVSAQEFLRSRYLRLLTVR